MKPLEVGTAIAVAVVGWPLYGMVTAGGMDATTALLRGSVVAVACVYGVSLIARLIERYEEEVEAERKRRLDELFTDMEGAVADGTLAETGADQPATPGPPSGATGAP